MPRERSPDVFGVRRRDIVFLQLKPGGGHVLECVFDLGESGLLKLIALSFGIDALCQHLAGFNCFLSGVCQ